MRRYDRTHFFVYGVVPALNAAGLLLYGLALATGSGSGGTERAVPLLLVLAALCLLATAAAAVKRGRDLGWSGGAALAGAVLCAALGPVLLLYAGYLALARGTVGENPHGPPAPPLSATASVWVVVATVAPWFAAVTAARLA